MDKIRLLIISDDVLLSRGMVAIFATEKRFEVVGCFDVDEAINKSIELQPDVILLDGAENLARQQVFICQIKRECPCSLVFILMDDEEAENLASVNVLEIDGVILKGIMRSYLVRTLELSCNNRLFCLPSSLKEKVFKSLAEDKDEPKYSKQFDVLNSEPLTKREMEILQLMAKNYSNREIASELFICEPTVKTHVSNILHKLGQTKRSKAITFSYNIGLISQSLGETN